MPWWKICDTFPDHPKTVTLMFRRKQGPIAVWALAGAWCRGNSTRGFVADAQLPRFNPSRSAAKELVEVGLWERVDGGYRFHDWVDYQPVSTEEQREVWREKKKGQRADVPGDMSGTAEGVSAMSGSPTPTPSPSVSSSKEETAKAAKAARLSKEEREDRIRDLSQRYHPGLATQLREAFAMTRDGGRISDGPFLKTLQVMARFPVDIVTGAAETYLDKHADGKKTEKYFLQIVRNRSKEAGTGTNPGTEEEETDRERSKGWLANCAELQRAMYAERDLRHTIKADKIEAQWEEMRNAGSKNWTYAAPWSGPRRSRDEKREPSLFGGAPKRARGGGS